jgi:microcystin synthetase protein McyA
LLSALVQTLAEWSGEARVLVDVEGHGREELTSGLETERTLGWFTTLSPVLFSVPAGGEPGALLREVKQQLRASKHNGLGYGLLRYLSPNAETRQALASLPKADVRFEYLGQFDQVLDSASPFALASESPGLTQCPRALRPHALSVGGVVAGGSLTLTWGFADGVHDEATITKLADRYSSLLLAQIEEYERGERAYAPSDFPRVKLDQAALTKALARVRRR